MQGQEKQSSVHSQKYHSTYTITVKLVKNIPKHRALRKYCEFSKIYINTKDGKKDLESRHGFLSIVSGKCKPLISRDRFRTKKDKGFLFFPRYRAEKK